jgi:cytochrome b subunit of formate dehydrogenase
MIWQIYLTLAIVLYISGLFIWGAYAEPYRREYNLGENIGRFCIALAFLSVVIAAIAGIWQV